MRHLELVSDARRELSDVALPIIAIERAALEAAAGTRLDLIVCSKRGGPDDGHDLVDLGGVERGVANVVPPGPQHDVLYGKLGEPCLREIRRLTRVVDLVPQRRKQLIVVHKATHKPLAVERGELEKWIAGYDFVVGFPRGSLQDFERV